MIWSFREGVWTIRPENAQGNKKDYPSERSEQSRLCRTLFGRGMLPVAIPNENAKHVAGLVDGFPDVMVLRRGLPAVYVEMKRACGSWSDLADNQRRMLRVLRSMGLPCCAAWGCRAALEAVDQWQRLLS